MNYQDYFKGKRITQLGLGLLGRGVGDAAFLAECGAILTVTDMKTKEDMAPSIEKLQGFPNITFKLGGHDLADFQDADMIIKAAGVPLDSPFIEEARKNNIPVEMDASLFVKLAEGITTIGVTGTRGKSTTANLIYEIVKKGFEKSATNVFLAGNIRDTATLPLLKTAKKGDIVVLELDSWQLQGFGDGKISPHIAVFTNFMEDHQNYYKGSMERYFEDKASIFLYQKQNDYLVTGETVAHLITAKYHGRLFNDPIAASPDSVPKEWNVKLKGRHNLENIAFAIKAAKILGISYEAIKEAVEGFDPVEGRLQFVKEVNGVSVYNDNNATTPAATIAALKALHSGAKNIILLCGGADKNIDLEDFASEMNRTCKDIILLPGTGTEKLKAMKGKIDIPLLEVSNLEEGVRKAYEKAESGDIVLFSPAFASFGLFKNEYERNDLFMKIIEKI